MDPTLLTQLSQFGAAGLIGVLWVLERRHAARRDRQLDEAHRKLLAQEHALGALLRVVQENTRAVVTLEQAQRRLIDLLEGPARTGTRPATGAAVPGA